MKSNCDKIESYDQIYKIILIGDSNTGKSSLFIRYIRGNFTQNVYPTIGVDFAPMVVEINDKTRIKVQIWDTAGQEKYRSTTRALLVYDVTKRDTFENAQRWLSELRQNAEPDCVIMLVANKIDLEGREVTTEEGKSFAEENRLMFRETSALENIKVKDSFEDLVHEIWSERRNIGSIVEHPTNYSLIIKNNIVYTKPDKSFCCYNSS